MTTYLIKAARPLGGDPVDILLKDGRIAAIGDSLSTTGAEVVEAAGLIALPGLVDLHTHLREPGREDAETVETGTLAAARLPVSTVSASSRPGSRRWVCRSTSPGRATSPAASTTSAPGTVRESPTAALRPSVTSRSTASSP